MTNLSDGIQTIEQLLGGDPQHNRLLVLDFPHKDGPSAMLLANRLDAYEGLSRDFRFTVEVLSDNAHIALKEVQGKNVTVALTRADGGQRHFNGYVFEFRFVRTDGNLAVYDMVLMPWLAYLRLRHDNYLFHGQTLQQQTADIFSDYAPLADWRAELTGSDEPMTDACQFDETDYNYLHRRWEALGWHYRYEHRADGHTLVLGDDTAASPAIDGSDDAIPWQADAGSMEEDGIAHWTPVRRIVPASVSASTFDFKQPHPMQAEVPTINQQGDVLKTEVYEYAGAYGFKNSNTGDQLVRLRMEEIEASGKHFEAAGNSRYVMPGRIFKLGGHFDFAAADVDAANTEFLVLECRHEAQNNYPTGKGATAYYANRLSCIRKTIPWRAGRGFNSVEPKIYGPQTAIVVGPKGEEIYTDKYGRVKVQFHWDRVGEYDDRSSAWIRVASNWTGKGYGFIAIPRVGQEVVVSFLDGNPDRPLVTGCVYNEENLPAWGFPAAAHQTGIQSRSSPGGAGHCEMVIHDRAGQELINIFSQKDMVRTVLNNDSTEVRGPRRTVAVTTGMQSTTVQQEVTLESKTSFIAETAKQHIALTSTDAHIAQTAKMHIALQSQTDAVMVKAATGIRLEVGSASLEMRADGTVLINGTVVQIVGSTSVDLNP